MLRRTATGVSIDFGGATMVLDLGVGIPIQSRWQWSFDGTLALEGCREGEAADSLGEYSSLTLTYADGAGPVVQQTVKVYSGDGLVLVESTALRELRGLSLGDSFFQTTFNSPVIRPAEGLSYLAYTWGLVGEEGTGEKGHFPDAALAKDLDHLPEQLRLADFSATQDLHLSCDKPFAPLIGYDSLERTMVMSPLDHFLISPMRLIDTPDGVAVARGLHGAVDVVPAGTTTRTALVFGQGLVATMLKWGEPLLRAGGQRVRRVKDSLPSKKLGFWNCYGGYYAELFRPMDAVTLKDLSDYFREADLPIGYWGLDLWYQFDQVGFARRYAPDPQKYPEGLQEVFRQTQIPFLLHMSSFSRTNDYLSNYRFTVDEGAAYPQGPQLYQDLAREFKDWGATGVWHDFLRTQMQNCRSLRETVGAADKWIDEFVTSMAQEGLDVMMCMPTMGHYLASANHENIVAVRTSTDYVNHQPEQLEMLSQRDDFRSMCPPQRNLRQNLMLSLVAGALGLAPSYDVFITNREHPEGFANPNATGEALARALSAGIVGVGDKLGWVDREIVDRLAFPDGTLSQPDHPPYPVVASLQTDVPAFFTTTVVDGYRWIYVALFNLSEQAAKYRFDLSPLIREQNYLVYDYHSARTVQQYLVSGRMQPGEGRCLILVPEAAGLYPLGFPGKYVTLSGRQVKGVVANRNGVSFDLELPAGRNYTFAAAGAGKLSASGQGLLVQGVEERQGLTYVDFRVEINRCSLVLRG